MLGHKYFYHANIRKIVSVFGALFNDIHIAKPGVQTKETLTDLQRVPLAYAPKDRYLARIDESSLEEKVAIRLPRMSFEITSIEYDAVTKLTKFNQTTQYDKDGNCFTVFQSTPYNISIDLNIMSRSQDEALQIVEQIIPFFNPSYTLSVKNLEGPDSITDIPISLNAVDHQDTYQGELSSSRRTVIYTLSFSAKVKFAGPYIPCGNGGNGGDGSGLIKAIDVNLLSFDNFPCGDPFGGIEVKTKFLSDTPEDFDCIINMGEPLDPDREIWPDQNDTP